MRFIGIDSGSTTTKGVVYDGLKIVDKLLVPTSYNPKQTLQHVLSQLGGANASYVVTTGYGRALLEEANTSLTEITCHAVGARFLNNDIRVVLDIGGQDSKVICLDRDGNVSDFIMNDKCAAGTGRFIEVIMRIVHRDLIEMDELVNKHKPEKISSMCAVFAESEVVSLLGRGCDPGDIALGVIESICERSSNFAKRVPIEGPVFLSGGLAQSEVIRKTLEKHIGVPVNVHDQSQYAGAIGAAILGYNKYSRK